MKLKTQSPHVRTVRDLLGLAVIGFVLWLAAIGWLPVSSANAALGAPKPSIQADAPLKPINDAYWDSLDNHADQLNPNNDEYRGDEEDNNT